MRDIVIRCLRLALASRNKHGEDHQGLFVKPKEPTPYIRWLTKEVAKRRREGTLDEEDLGW